MGGGFPRESFIREIAYDRLDVQTGCVAVQTVLREFHYNLLRGRVCDEMSEKVYCADSYKLFPQTRLPSIPVMICWFGHCSEIKSPFVRLHFDSRYGRRYTRVGAKNRKYFSNRPCLAK